MVFTFLGKIAIFLYIWCVSLYAHKIQVHTAVTWCFFFKNIINSFYLKTNAYKSCRKKE